MNLFREEKGHHFDPGVVDVFFQNLQEIIEIRDTFHDQLPAHSE